MKKILSLILSLVMVSMMGITIFSAAENITLTFDLKSGGQNDIVVKTGDIITVAYSLSSSETTSVSVTQNEIYYDHNFFEFVEGSNKASSGFTDYTTTLQTRLDGKRYVYFNTMVTHSHNTTPSEIGTFQLKVIATEGETTVSSVNYMAFDINALKYESAANDLHVSIGEPQIQKFTVLFNNEDGSTFEKIVVESGNSLTIPEGPAKSGYTFSHWSIGGDTTKYTPGLSYTPTSDVTFTPNWTKNNDEKPDDDVVILPKPIPGGSIGSGNGSSEGVKTYFIEASAEAGGAISPSGNVPVVANSSKTFVIHADFGYEIEYVLVDDEDIGAVSEYTFSNIKESHTIEAFFKEVEKETEPEPETKPETKPEAPANPFVDVSNDAYYHDAVLWAVENGVTTGITATVFNPDSVCTRAQAVTFLWRGAGKPAPKSTTMPFVDVAEGVYYYDAVLWAVENGITTGLSDTTFSPDSSCTRAQIVTFLWRAAGKPAPKNSENPFVDVSSDAYYYDAVLWAVENGITYGSSDTTFSPASSCTRAQIVTFMYRADK